MNITIAISAATSELKPAAEKLAAQLNLACEFTQPEKYDFLLLYTPNYLALQKTNSNANPLYIDFLSGKMQHRRKQVSLRNELLARALGLKNKTPRKIIDATAGLARDSFILATLGFEVTLLERSPIVCALIQDAIQRAKQSTEVAPIVERLNLINTDAITWLTNNTAEIVYIDPMFPESKKSALSKQDMRFFHEIVGDDLDADSLLKSALTCATKRVVVKRPRLAAPLLNMAPALNMQGSSNRFDIYLIPESHGNTTSAT